MRAAERSHRAATDELTEPPRDFHGGVERLGALFRDQAFEFEKLAVGYSQKGFETLTYLNDGDVVQFKDEA